MHVNEEYFWREICKHEPKMNLLYRRRKIGGQDISKYYEPLSLFFSYEFVGSVPVALLAIFMHLS